MSKKIKDVLYNTRKEKNLTRIQVCGNLLSENEYRNIETGKMDGSVWMLRQLLGRLKIPESSVVFYLGTKENDMINLEIEIYRRIMVWNYREAEEKLEKFFDWMDKENVIQVMIYYRLFFLIYRKRIEKEKIDAVKEKIKNTIDYIENRLQKREVLSIDELAILTEYYATIFCNIKEQSIKLYEIIDYCKTEYLGVEGRNKFYAQLSFYYAQNQYLLEEYPNCMESCKEGLKVTSIFGNCNNTAELFELLADAKGKLLQKSNCFNETYNKSQIEEIIQNYRVAYDIYSLLYCDSAKEQKEKLMEKITIWKTMIWE